jgi:ABC-type proline/glycine betaine transport system permease subunit
MNCTEKAVENLKITHSVINRLGRNSFLVKSWSMIIIVAAMVLIAKHEVENPYFALALILPVMAFGSWTDISSGKKGCSEKCTTRSETNSTPISR